MFFLFFYYYPFLYLLNDLVQTTYPLSSYLSSHDHLLLNCPFISSNYHYPFFRQISLSTIIPNLYPLTSHSCKRKVNELGYLNRTEFGEVLSRTILVFVLSLRVIKKVPIYRLLYRITIYLSMDSVGLELRTRTRVQVKQYPGISIINNKNVNKQLTDYP